MDREVIYIYMTTFKGLIDQETNHPLRGNSSFFEHTFNVNQLPAVGHLHYSNVPAILLTVVVTAAESGQAREEEWEEHRRRGRPHDAGWRRKSPGITLGTQLN